MADVLPVQLNEIKRIEDRIERRRGELHDRLRDRGPDDEQPDERLVCPSCRQVFELGSTCLECNTALVGESLLDAYEVPVEDHMWRRVVMFMAVIALGMAASSLMI